MENKKKKEILLESGTNELEIVEFSVGNALYGINIAKVREIITANINIVQVPNAHFSLEGAINLRGKIIPVINLAKHLKEDVNFEKKSSRIIISEFNHIILGFLVSSVANIHRLSWRQVEKPSDMLQSDQGYTVGVIKIDEKIIFLLDFEKIAGYINPKASIIASKDSNYVPPKIDFDRSAKKIIVAEDSDFIRGMIVDYLEKAGYQVAAANDGEEAWNYIEYALRQENFQKIDDYYHLLITDIEMPQVDGLHLIKKIKENPVIRNLPCIAFSSMITTELIRKCRSVGSDGEISKPEIEKLVNLVDSKVL